MKSLESAPFRGDPVRIGSRKSADSVVVLLPGQLEVRDNVVKWNKSKIADKDEVFRIAEFSQKAVSFYRAILGGEFVVPTQVVVGQKRIDDSAKYKVYLAQPYIDGWNGAELPEDLREDRILLEQWRVLYSRLSTLYLVAREVNRQFKEPNHAFPINMTLGFSRAQAYGGIAAPSITTFPNTPNILVGRKDFKIAICDFGEYIPWRDSMLGAYNNIMKKSLKAISLKEGRIF